jgi:DNA-binding transcriptional ArsR family regulator
LSPVICSVILLFLSKLPKENFEETKKDIDYSVKKELSNDSNSNNTTPAVPESIGPVTESNPNEITTKLQHLKDLFDTGLITKEEYDKKRQSLVDAM